MFNAIQFVQTVRNRKILDQANYRLIYKSTIKATFPGEIKTKSMKKEGFYVSTYGGIKSPPLIY